MREKSERRGEDRDRGDEREEKRRWSVMNYENRHIAAWSKCNGSDHSSHAAA